MLKSNLTTLFLRIAPRLPRFGLAALCLFSFFWRLGSAPLFDLDEALYVGGARQMLLTGDLVTPRLNSRPERNPARTTVPFYEKPIMIYWLAAASQKVFGMNLLAARLPAALASLLTTALIALFGCRYFGERAGLLAGMVYAASPLTLLDARQMTTDSLLALWITAALLTAASGLVSEEVSEANTRVKQNTSRLTLVQMFFFWGGCAFAVLTKGIIGLLLPALILGVFVLSEVWAERKRAAQNKTPAQTLLRDYPAALWQTFRRLRPLAGLTLFLLIAVPWHVLAAQTGERDAQGRTFYQEYVIRQHVNRFRGGKNGDTVHTSPPVMYFLYYAIGFFPWAFFTPAAFKKEGAEGTGNREQGTETEKTKNRKQKTEGESTDAESIQNPKSKIQNINLRRFLLCWFGVIFVFFSIGAAKLPTYIAPLGPPAALLIGIWLESVWRGGCGKQAVRGAFGAALSAGILFAAVLVAPHYLPKNLTVPDEAIRLAQIIAAVLFFGSALALTAFMRKMNRAGIVLSALTVLALIGIGCTAGYDFAAREGFGPYQRLAQQANRYAAQNTPIVYYDIIPRMPSTLYRADYSPREFSRAPLLPYLRSFLTPQSPAAVVLCSRKTLDTKLRPELAAKPNFTLEILAQDGTIGGGWVLLRLTEASRRE